MKLLVADDHTLFKETLVQYIKRAEPASDVMLAGNFNEVLEILKRNPSLDLILLDLRMPGMDGLKGLQRIRLEYPDLRVALMSGLAEPQDVKQAMTLGAAGYFPKTLSGKALLKGIRQVLDGIKFMPLDEATGGYMPSYYEDSEQARRAGGDDPPQHKPVQPLSPAGHVVLTAREQEVLLHLSQGSTNKEIAQILGLQVVTVKLHVHGVCQKLGVKNRTQAALKAREMGLGV